jgi:uncharacterized membrane protein
MTTRAAHLWSLASILAVTAVAVLLYARLPDPVPTHWNMRGVANGFTPKPWGAFMGPLVMTGLWALFFVLPRISPKGYQLSLFEHTYAFMQTLLIVFLGVVTSTALLAGAGIPVPVERVVPVALSVFIMLLGNLLGRVRKNFFVGIRTPWTLASDEVWLRTHRLAGWLMVLAGAVSLVASLAGASHWVMVSALSGAALFSTVYSYVLYRRIEG